MSFLLSPFFDAGDAPTGDRGIPNKHTVLFHVIKEFPVTDSWVVLVS